MALIKGILSFPTLFTPKVAKGATEPKFSIGVLLPPTDPQVVTLQNEIAAAKSNAFPSGYTGVDECFGLYDEKYKGKEYYDVRFSGWYIFTSSAKADARPKTVDLNYNDIIDPSAVYSGMVGYVNAGISGYTKGKGGIGGWLNGVMITDEEMPMGRLDGRPSVEQMFGAVGATQPPPQTPAPAAPAAPPTPAAAHSLVMTDKAGGVTLEAYLATPGWTEQMLIDQGLAIRTSF